jgi:hypothetical protein
MFSDFQLRHLPALFTAAAQCWATIWPLVSGGSPRDVMRHYGLPERMVAGAEPATATETVWRVGNARTACLGILMFWFYAERRYDVLDVFLAVSGGYLGVVDCYLLCAVGRPAAGLGRLLGSLVFAVLGLLGFTQG